MLAYLDALVAAIAAGHPAEIARLLAHPLSRTLTREARIEAEHAAAGHATAAPLRLLQLRHQAAQLLGEHADAPEREPQTVVTPVPAHRTAARSPARHQMELPLSA